MTTLKMQYSNAMKDYVFLKLGKDGYFIYAGTMPLTYAIDNVELANELFYFHINK
jgi:hypothetical protein